MRSFKNVFNIDLNLCKKIIKCTVAYQIATIIILIPKVSQDIGAVPYLVTLGTLFFNPSSTAGNQISEMALNLMCLVPACLWVGVISYTCTVYNSHIDSASLYTNGAGVIAGVAVVVVVELVAVGLVGLLDYPYREILHHYCYDLVSLIDVVPLKKHFVEV